MTTARAAGSIVLLAALLTMTLIASPARAEVARDEVDEDGSEEPSDDSEGTEAPEDGEASDAEESDGAEEQATWEARRGEARSDEDVGTSRIESEEVHAVGEIVDVIDAADGDDRFDFTFRVGYGYHLTRVKLTQQCEPGTASLYGCAPGEPGVTAFRDVARYNHIQHVLNLEATFGIYRDLEIYTTWPIILQDQREIVRLESNDVPYDENLYLLRFPFTAANRFGVDQFNLGISWLPFSQERNATLPTWLINIEGQFAIGDPMRPSCSDENGGVQASDVVRTDDPSLAAATCNTDGGISERHHDVVMRMTLSRRFGVVEPYIGFLTEVEFPEEGDYQRYGHGGYDYPLYTEAHFGLEVVPWERVEREQFFRIGLHLWGGYNREVLNYGPLYDVLGTNPNMHYRFETYDPDSGPNPSSNWGLSQDDTSGHDDAFTGLTRIEGHGSFGGRLTLTVQVARYVKFSLGASLAHDQEHFVTFSDQCRIPRGGEGGTWDGPDSWDCTNHDTIFVDEWRPQIDSVGRRFRAEETTIFQAFADINIQF
jgi:hypothetical protein